MLPSALEDLSEKLRLFPGIGRRSSQKLAIDVLNLPDSDFEELLLSLKNVKDGVKFCTKCGFFAEKDICNICSNPKRDHNQICLVEKPTDVITIEKSENYDGSYHVLGNLISPLDNIFAENTTVDHLLDRIKNLLSEKQRVELILFFKAGFASEATTAYIKEKIDQNEWTNVRITRLAQGLPLYYNPDTLDQATMIKALEDRREID